MVILANILPLNPALVEAAFQHVGAECAQHHGKQGKHPSRQQ